MSCCDGENAAHFQWKRFASVALAAGCGALGGEMHFTLLRWVPVALDAVSALVRFEEVREDRVASTRRVGAVEHSGHRLGR